MRNSADRHRQQVRYRRLLTTAGFPVLVLGIVLTAATQRVAPEFPVGQEGAVGREPAEADHAVGPATRAGAGAERGLRQHSAAACAGYTLFAPMNATTTYLVDLQGNVTHTWPSAYEPGMSAYLLSDGSLLRAARDSSASFFGGGIGGRVQRIARDGSVLWDFQFSDESRCQHHDIHPLPNGNVLLVAWERKTRDEALSAGRNPDRMSENEMWPDCVVEIAPQGATGGRVVWEWHVWDHLVQDVDAGLPNYGVVAQHPERVDVNFERSLPREGPAELRRLRALGYVGGVAPEEEEGTGDGPTVGPGPAGPGDWCHVNSVDYNPELDQVLLSVHTFNEIWVIDHSTTTEEAARDRGGRYGKGGDLLYRWGNPQAYGMGCAADQQLFGQHDARWIPAGMPGAGHITLFNNGMGRPDGHYSTVVELAPPIDPAGRYLRGRGTPCGPAEVTWEYKAPNAGEFFSGHISGAERLPNGNTLICAGEQGRIFEVTVRGETVWDYSNPFIERGRRRGPPPLWAPSSSRPAHDGPDSAGATTRPRGPRRPPPGMRGPGPWGPPGPGGGPPPGMPGGPPGGQDGGLFRATRVPPEHPGVQALLRTRAVMTAPAR